MPQSRGLDGSSHGSGAFMEGEPVEVVGDIGQDEFRFGPGDADGAADQHP